jgi:two-component system response regulator RpfG
LRRQRQIISSRAQWLEDQVVVATQQILAREQETLLRLARAGEYRDEHTGNHVMRIAKFCRLLAQSLGLPKPECDAIELASPMHDIGKIGIPDYILLKPGKLTPSEFAVMRGHSRLGYEILCDSQSIYIQLGAIIALYHHEKFDGSGYPDGLRGEAIPLPARIVAVADVFDALTSFRPYKAPWSTEAAAAHIGRLSGSHFDPRCVDALFALLPEIERVRNGLRDDVDAASSRGILASEG